MENLEMGGGYTPEENKLSPREKLVQNGIAERMVETVNKYNNPARPYNVEECNFKVEQTIIPAEESRTGEEEVHTQVIIETPNSNPERRSEQPMVRQGFAAEKGRSFGVGGDPPLTEEQWETVQDILKEQNEKESNENN